MKTLQSFWKRKDVLSVTGDFSLYERNERASVRMRTFSEENVLIMTWTNPGRNISFNT